MVEVRYIYKKGKKFGPYYYQTYRNNGKVKKHYIGSREDYTAWRKKNKCSTTNWKLAIIPLLILIFVSLTFIYLNYNGISGHAVLSIENTYLAGENISGDLKLVLKSGELLPADTKIIVEQSSGTREFSLSDFLNVRNENISEHPKNPVNKQEGFFGLTSGEYYAEGFNLSGQGEGVGFAGEKIVYPDVYFTLLLSSGSSESGSVSEPEIVQENQNQEPQVAENQTQESIPSIETPTSTESTPVETPASIETPTSTESTPVETPVETPIQTPVETPAESSVGSSITGSVILQNEQEVEGVVSANKSFNYNVGENSVSFKNIHSDYENLSSSVLESNLENGDLIVTTDYSYNQKGFGSEYIGSENELKIYLDKLGIKAENGQLKIRLAYGNDVFAEQNREIIVENLTERIVNETLITEIGNETLTNETLTNETLTNGTLKRYNVVINHPVKWQKKISVENLSEISVELPKKSENISVKTGDEIAIAEQQAQEEENTIQEDKSSLITGNAVLNENSTGVLSRIWKKLTGSITGKVVENVNTISETNDSKIVSIDLNNVAAEILVEYTTPGPVANETNISNGKKVTISASSELNYTDILAYSELDNRISIENKNEIKIYHVVNGSREETSFDAYDLDGDGKIDYIEWVVPHLSEQVYEIIYITKAEHLDENRTFVEDVYDIVKAQDNNWTTIPNGDYVRVTFEKNLTNQNDITIYARGSNSEIEVYIENKNKSIARFENILNEGWYKILLTNLSDGENYDVFDLKSIGSVDYDYIVDPYVDNGSVVQSVNDCGLLNTTNGVYTLINNVTSNGTCFTIGAFNVTLDGAGYTINYSANGTLGYGVYNVGNSSFIIKNARIVEGKAVAGSNFGILITKASNGIINNNTVIYNSAAGRGIYFYLATTRNNTVSNNTIIGNGNSGIGLGIDQPNNGANYFYDNNITTNGGSGILMYSTHYNILNNNLINNYGTNGKGMDIYYYVTATRISNMTIKMTGTNSYGIRLSNVIVINNTFSEMNINTYNSGSYPLYVNTNNPDFTMIDSVMNNSFAGLEELYVRNQATGGEWNFTNVTRGNGNPINVSWTVGGNGTLNMFWYLSAYTNYTNGSIAANTNVSSYNVNGLFVAVNLTDSSGNMRQTLLEYKRNSTSGSNRTYYGNYTINATSPDRSETLSQSVNMSINRNLVFTLTSDTLYPTFSNYWDNNATLVSSGMGLFNVTIANTNGTVLLEINGVNVTATNLTADVYNASYTFTGNGTYSYKWGSWSNGTSHLYNISATRGYTVNYSDTIYPQFSNFGFNYTNGSVYVNGIVYIANSTISNTNGTAGIQFNGVNYTVTNVSSLFTSTLGQLSAGTYNYYWWAYGNGTAHNYNVSATYSYTVNKSNSLVYNYLNDSRDNLTIYAGTSIWLNASRITGEGSVFLYNNGTLINFGVNISNYTLFSDVGMYNITAIYSPTANYSSSFETWWLNVTQVPFSLAIDLSSQLTGQISWNIASLPMFNQSANGNNGEAGATNYFINISVSGGTADLYVKANGNLMTSGNDVLDLGNETYSFNSTDTSVPSSQKFSLTTNYADNKIGDSLNDGDVVYLKFFLSAPSGQAIGTYNNTLSFEAVQHGQAP